MKSERIIQTTKNSHNHKKIKFIMLLGKALHRYGTSADRIEKALSLVSEKLNIQADYFSLPTGIFASFKHSGTDENSTEETRMVRLPPGKVNLSKLYHVDKTVDLTLDNEMSIDDCIIRINNILDQKPLYNSAIVTLSYGLISAGVSIFLHGSWMDTLVSGILGLFVGLFSETVREERIDSISEGINAYVITFISIIISHFIVGLNTNIIVLSSLIALVPGLMLTTSIGELASQNLTSGTARLMGSIVVLLKISFGVYIANLSASYFGFSPTSPATSNYHILFIILMIITVGIGLSISFQARKEDFIWIVIAALLSYFSSRLFLLHFGEAASPFLSGCVIAAASNIFSRVMNRPAMIFLLPAIILLVPGSIGFRGVNLLFQNDLLAGVDSIFKMAITGIALVSGTFFGSILIKPRRAL